MISHECVSANFKILYLFRHINSSDFVFVRSNSVIADAEIILKPVKEVPETVPQSGPVVGKGL